MANSKDTVTLAPDAQFGTSSTITTSYSFIIDFATTNILEQPNFQHLNDVKNLQQHQIDSKATATTWRTDVRSELYTTNDAILAFNSKFAAFYKPLYEFAEKIDEDPKARSNLVLGLNELKNEIDTQKARVDQAGKKLNDFYNAMTTNMANITADYNQVTASYEGDKGRLEDLKKQIAALDEAMNNDITTIGAGAAGIVVGLLGVAVGVALWLETGGVSTPIIVAGFVAAAGVIGGSTAVGIAAKNYNDRSDDKANVIRDINNIKSEIAVAVALQSGISTLTQNIGTAADACDHLSKAWSQLGRDYDTLIGTLKSTNPEKLSFIVKASLETAKHQWNTIAADAQKIKDALLTPPKVDTSALQNPPSAALKSYRVPSSRRALRVTAVTSMAATPTYASSPAFDKTSDLKHWIDETARALLAFQEALQTSIVADGAPTAVVAANQKLKNNSDSISEASNLFLYSIEDLSKLAPTLRATALLDDDVIVTLAVNVFKDLNNLLTVAKTNGTTAMSKTNEAESSVLETKSAINGWLSELNIQKNAENQQMDEFVKLRDEAEAEKDNSKNDYWWCLLGVVACVVVAIEQSQKVSSANAKIGVLNDQIQKTSASLSLVSSTWQSVFTLGSMIDALRVDLDGILKALQVISTSIDGINASNPSVTPFVVCATLKTIATQIENLSTIRMNACGRRLKSVVKLTAIRPEMREEVTLLLLEDMQQLTSQSMNIQSVAKLVVSQPKLSFVEALLRQNQELLITHALNWKLSYASRVISTISRLRGLGQSFENLGPLIRDFVTSGDIGSVVQGLDSVDADLSKFLGYIFETKLLCRQFLSTVKDDKSRFETVRAVLTEKLEGDVQALQMQEASLAAELSQALEDTVNATTKLIIHHLMWELVLGVSLVVGQVAVAPAVEGAAVMNLVKKGSEMVIKKVSQAAAGEAQREIMTLGTDQNAKVAPIIEKRAQAIVDLSELSADVAILHVLLQSVNDISNNADKLLDTLAIINGHVSNEIQKFYTIKLLVQSDDKTKALAMLDASLADWKSIASAADTLEQTFVSSF